MSAEITSCFGPIQKMRQRKRTILWRIRNCFDVIAVKPARYKSSVNGFLAEMLGEHIIDHCAVFVAIGLAIGIHCLGNTGIEIGAIGKTELIDQEIVFDRIKFGLIGAGNR